MRLLCLAGALLAALPAYAAFDSDGSDGAYVRVPHTPTIEPSGDFTVEMWANLTDRSTYQGLAFKRTWPAGTDFSYALAAQDQAATTKWRPAFFVDGDGWSVADTDLDYGTWYHAAVTWDGSDTLTFYVDGVADGSAVLANDPGTNAGILRLAGDWATGLGCDCQVAEVRLWDDVRTPEELMANRFRRVAGNEADLIGYWPGDEMTLLNAADHTETAAPSPGTLQAGVGWADGPPIAYGGE